MNIYNISRLFTAMWSLKSIVQYECIHVLIHSHVHVCLLIMHVLA